MVVGSMLSVAAGSKCSDSLVMRSKTDTSVSLKLLTDKRLEECLELHHCVVGTDEDLVV